MKRFRDILLVQDPGGGSQHAFENALELAKRNGGRIKILSALGEVPPLPRIGDVADVNLQQLIYQEFAERHSNLVTRAREEGVEAESCVRLERPFLAIVREVLESRHDLVIKTAEGSGGLESRLFGSTALHLIRKCPCPVWIVKATDDAKRIPKKIVAAVDPSPDDDALATDDDHFKINDKILELATSLARMHGSRLVVAHAWELQGESLLRGRGRISSETVDRLADETLQAHEAEIGELLARHDLSGLESEVRLAKGDAGDVIPAVVEREHADLLLMGSVGRTGIAGLLVGNTAEKVLDRVRCSVLTVKPHGFVSPVRLPESRAMESS